MKKIEFPIVIVGKDRTLMTASVIQQIYNNLNNDLIESVFIVVSDQSRKGHNEFIESALSKISNRYFVLKTSEESNGLGAAMNKGLRKAFEIYDKAFIIENDWFLRTKLNLTDYIDVIDNGDIGCVSFKQINSYNNINLTEYRFKNKDFIIKNKIINERKSFNIEFGCQIVSKRLIDNIGYFLENAKPQEVEDDYLKRFNDNTDEEKVSKRILSANDKRYIHSNLNDERCIFFHIGMHSSQNAYWKIPKQFEYLTNDSVDRTICYIFNREI